MLLAAALAATAAAGAAELHEAPQKQLKATLTVRGPCGSSTGGATPAATARLRQYIAHQRQPLQQLFHEQQQSPPPVVSVLQCQYTCTVVPAGIRVWLAVLPLAPH
ncbi:hypothetical protein cyc_01876 [Cyclospora cayetanensis]|uniref:Uncharacterized protein n=1 Tax=Cyclospora cayetanensis TaxID=88456 RepID=A0A1D3D3R0_9EIME|nr:hypothetical protein cyc_01876 [Cyclospora cayetanensis]